jgi:hypothetical protein
VIPVSGLISSNILPLEEIYDLMDVPEDIEGSKAATT